ncbi:sigma-54-dependent transcriptional regulator [Pelotalea chapellei]|uniref:Sigma-54 dependent transcriptional regulator n=1 Tax=Pelotalea chapellei TaxID=44671 RepID=A0ABS5U5K3_9BACT|nr:sigma-54 dependent transcriptional regulator [Pelotalea chapellei]MBT1070953.1 sigma-54 dependent transcriptional regulator [Pelotalea chapellei]
MKPAVLLIEDNEGTRFGFFRYFSKEGYEISEAADLASATHSLASRPFDAIVLDINLPDGNGLDFIETVRGQDPCIPIIVITGSGDVPLAVEAMQRGADNFLSKPVDNAALGAYLRKTLEIGTLKRRLSAQKRLTQKEDIFFGRNRYMQEISHIARAAASGDTPVLITGETGTGKGMLANWIHRHSKRSSQEFVSLNCSSLRGEMLARELFGNARGAFTSADQDRKGLLDIADRGTLFLDEIGDMGMEIQAQLLKVLEEKTYRRLGDVKLYRSDFRPICATHHNIENLVREKLFRQDLMYRINLVVIHLPPLRERLDDLPSLVAYLLRTLGVSEAVLEDDVMQVLMDYPWPGNIRELKNVLERALLLAPRGTRLGREHFSCLIQHPPGRATQESCSPTVQEIQQRHIQQVVEQMNGDLVQAAKSLNISRATLYRRLKQIRDSQP